MKGTSRFAVLVLALAALGGCHTYVKSMDDLPAPVKATLEKESADGGSIGDIQKRHRNGMPDYLAEGRDKDGRGWDVSVAEDGRVIGKD